MRGRELGVKRIGKVRSVRTGNEDSSSSLSKNAASLVFVLSIAQSSRGTESVSRSSAAQAAGNRPPTRLIECKPQRDFADLSFAVVTM